MELVAASALAVMMVVAISGVLRSMRAQRKALTDGALLNTHWRQALADQIRWDVTNARDMVARTEELRLLGFCGHDSTSGEATHRLTEVTYAIREIGGRSCLVRHERRLDGQGASPATTEVVGIGITGIVLMGQASGSEDDVARLIGSLPVAREGSNRKRPASDQWVPVPKTFRLLLLGPDRQPIIDQAVVL